jgi:hypothetical protein
MPENGDIRFRTPTPEGPSQPLLSRPSVQTLYLSPTKDCGHILSQAAADLIKSPSPYKLVRDQVICRNIGNLLQRTPGFSIHNLATDL